MRDYFFLYIYLILPATDGIFVETAHHLLVFLAGQSSLKSVLSFL